MERMGHRDGERRVLLWSRHEGLATGGATHVAERCTIYELTREWDGTHGHRESCWQRSMIIEAGTMELDLPPPSTAIPTRALCSEKRRAKLLVLISQGGKRRRRRGGRTYKRVGRSQKKKEKGTHHHPRIASESRPSSRVWAPDRPTKLPLSPARHPKAKPTSLQGAQPGVNPRRANARRRRNGKGASTGAHSEETSEPLREAEQRDHDRTSLAAQSATSGTAGDHGSQCC